VSPGGVGFDINCGVRLLRSSLTRNDVQPRLRELVNQVFRDVPCGTGGSGFVKVGAKDLDALLVQGARWMVRNGYGEARDAEYAEAGGALDDADPGAVSDRAKERAGPRWARWAAATTSSRSSTSSASRMRQPRGSSDWLRDRWSCWSTRARAGSGTRSAPTTCARWRRDGATRHQRADRQLACVPVRSREGQRYLGAMRAAGQLRMGQSAGHHALPAAGVHQGVRPGRGPRRRLRRLPQTSRSRRRTRSTGAARRVLVHRKGATRAFPAQHPDIPLAYREVGQPVFVPGSMGTASWCLAGESGAMAETFGTACHGAAACFAHRGPTWPRREEAWYAISRRPASSSAARRATASSRKFPRPTRTWTRLIGVVHGAGIARKVARLRPMGVIKG